MVRVSPSVLSHLIRKISYSKVTKAAIEIDLTEGIQLDSPALPLRKF
jgi:hypothetical protein